MSDSKVKIGENNNSPIVTGTVQGDFTNFVKESMETNINQYHSGSGDNIAGNKKTTNVYSCPELTKIGSDIQAIVEDLEQVYNPNTKKGKEKIVTEAIQIVDKDPSLVKRIISVSEQALFAYLQARFISPIQSALIVALKSWKKDTK